MSVCAAQFTSVIGQSQQVPPSRQMHAVLRRPSTSTKPYPDELLATVRHNSFTKKVNSTGRPQEIHTNVHRTDAVRHVRHLRHPGRLLSQCRRERSRQNTLYMNSGFITMVHAAKPPAASISTHSAPPCSAGRVTSPVHVDIATTHADLGNEHDEDCMEHTKVLLSKGQSQRELARIDVICTTARTPRESMPLFPRQAPMLRLPEAHLLKSSFLGATGCVLRAKPQQIGANVKQLLREVGIQPESVGVHPSSGRTHTAFITVLPTFNDQRHCFDDFRVFWGHAGPKLGFAPRWGSSASALRLGSSRR